MAKVFSRWNSCRSFNRVGKNRPYEFVYLEGYCGPSVSLTMPITRRDYLFDRFPPFFAGLLPEGFMLDALLKKTKLDNDDRFE